MYERLHGIKAMILRVANPFGERQRVETAQGAVGVFLDRALQRQRIDIWGNGEVSRDYLHIEDVATAFAAAATYVGKKSVFNISSGVGTSINQLLALIEEVLGRPVERQYLPGRAFDVPVSILSNALAREEMGWEPKIALREGLLRTADWLKHKQAG